MGKIKILDPQLVNLIAAGEVVERPASVIKELVENSIDAQASKIILHVQEGGLSLIKISDDGSGMSPADAELSLVQHATSKISNADDLDNIYTLGFRGEALASISAVADVTIDTKADTGEAITIISNQGEISTKPSPRSTTGTTISVANIFASVPARRKFLRSAQTEFNHILETFINIALVHPNIHFELHHNQKLVHRLPPVTQTQDRIYEIWGEKIAHNLYNNRVEIPGGHIDMLLGKPDIGRHDRKLQYIFVNSRYISDRALQKAIADGYLGFLPKENYPVYFVALTLDPHKVDVNVHPRKLEVRIENSQQLFSIIRGSIADTLTKQTKADMLQRMSSSTAILNQNNAGEDKAEPASSVYKSNGSGGIPSFLSSPAGKYQPGTSATSGSRYSSRPGFGAGRNKVNDSLNFTKSLLQSQNDNSGGAANQGINPQTATDQPTQTKSDLLVPITNIHNPIQIFSTYILYQHDEKIIIIDQHAAAEKILYEKLRRQLDHTKSRPLLMPVIIDLTADEKQKTLEIKDKISQAGVEISDFGGNAIQVSSLPELTPHLNVENFIQDLITGRMDKEPAGEVEQLTQTISTEAHYLIATLACHGAIRAGQRLTVPEMQQVITDLNQCEFPYNCPHGRPVSWVMTKYELEKNFKRIL